MLSQNDIYIYIRIKTKNKRNGGGGGGEGGGGSTKTAMKQVANNGRYKKGRGSIGNWEALMELYWGL